ncbi:C40 family peptidase [Noviherbaspirillum massiliense]|uniref:C40 family peptidase n=1 Tax=Noviherbaspirillum massiliense TaxID=1465823 RepID=UPI0002E7C4BB|nr:C40 family peptidase [Noviherbaspirillum massiliense]
MRLCALILGCCCVFGAAHASDEPGEAVEANAELPVHADKTSELTMRAIGMIGTRYRYGGDVPETGVDCSGLVRYLFKEVWDADLPRTSTEISRFGRKIHLRDLQPGDLVFFNTLRRAYSHVGIYLGDNKFIHAPASGGHVRIESMTLRYWKKRFNGARRMNEPEADSAPASDQAAMAADAGRQHE